MEAGPQSLEATCVHGTPLQAFIQRATPSLNATAASALKGSKLTLSMHISSPFLMPFRSIYQPASCLLPLPATQAASCWRSLLSCWDVRAQQAMCSAPCSTENLVISCSVSIVYSAARILEILRLLGMSVG